MAKILIDAGLKANISILSQGEFYYCIDTEELYIGNGKNNILLNPSVESISGKDGLSAYEIWLKTHTGTEEDFLNSLIGEKGIQGNPGLKGDKGDKGNDGTPADMTRVSKLENQLKNFNLWSGTQSEYDSIPIKDSNTIYFITE